MGLSCVTHCVSPSFCSSNRTDKVFPCSVLPGGERIRDTQEQLVNLKKMTARFVKRSNRIVKWLSAYSEHPNAELLSERKTLYYSV